MGKGQMMNDIRSALIHDDPNKAVLLWHELKKSGVDLTKHPLFFLSAAKAFAAKGDMEAVVFNLNKAIKLLGD